MKKIMFILLAGLMTLSLVSCGGNENEEAEVTSADTTLSDVQSMSEYETDFEEPVAGIANPWIETDAADITAKCGNTFGVPEGASDIVYRWCENEHLAEMQFKCGGIEWNARMQKIPVYEDISGMNYTWEGETQTDVLAIPGFLRVYHGENEVATSVLWQDDLEYRNEYMLSLSCVSDKEADLSIAKEIFTPHQQ